MLGVNSQVFLTFESSVVKTHSEPSQVPKTERFAKNVNSFAPSQMFDKVLNIPLGRISPKFNKTWENYQKAEIQSRYPHRYEESHKKKNKRKKSQFIAGGKRLNFIMSDFSLKYTNFIIEKQKKISQTQRLGLKKQIALSISLYCITFTTCYVILVIFDL